MWVISTLGARSSCSPADDRAAKGHRFDEVSKNNWGQSASNVDRGAVVNSYCTAVIARARERPSFLRSRSVGLSVNCVRAAVKLTVDYVVGEQRRRTVGCQSLVRAVSH
jgi:hypothetical protein